MPRVRDIGVAMLGHGFMGDAHSRAFRGVGTVTWPAPLRPHLVSISGRDEATLEVTRRRYGWQEAVTDWTVQVEDPRVRLFDNVGPNHLHVEPTLAALRTGKHVICEKPLAPSPDDAHALWDAAEHSGVVHVCAFNYRFFPAIRVAREAVRAGDLGDLLHFRARFFTPRQDSVGWRETEPAAGGGVVVDMISHHIDLARYLVGEIEAVSAAVAHGSREDAVVAALEFDQGVTGAIEASRLTRTPRVESIVEIDGTEGSLTFSLARLNELTITDPGGTRALSVMDPSHPFMRSWYPRGHPIGWGDSFLHEIDHVLRVIAGEIEPSEDLPTFRDGYRCAAVCDAVRVAARRGDRVTVRYRDR